MGARFLALEADAVPPFPLEETVAALAADPPHWPASTTDLRRARLLLRFSSAGLLCRAEPPPGNPRPALANFPSSRSWRLRFSSLLRRSCALAPPTPPFP